MHRSTVNQILQVACSFVV